MRTAGAGGAGVDGVVVLLFTDGEALGLGRQWLAGLGLARFGGYFPHQLSGGMRKRVAIAQSWIADPDIVLMDEPFSALGAQTRQLTEQELLGLWAGCPKTVVLVTHDLAEAVALSDEVVLLSAGPASRVVGVQGRADGVELLVDIRPRTASSPSSARMTTRP